MAPKLAPAEKNSTDISAASATFCISVKAITLLIQRGLPPVYRKKLINISCSPLIAYMPPRIPVMVHCNVAEIDRFWGVFFLMKDSL